MKDLTSSCVIRLIRKIVSPLSVHSVCLSRSLPSIFWCIFTAVVEIDSSQKVLFETLNSILQIFCSLLQLAFCRWFRVTSGGVDIDPDLFFCLIISTHFHLWVLKRSIPNRNSWIFVVLPGEAISSSDSLDGGGRLKWHISWWNNDCSVWGRIAMHIVLISALILDNRSCFLILILSLASIGDLTRLHLLAGSRFRVSLASFVVFL